MKRRSLLALLLLTPVVAHAQLPAPAQPIQGLTDGLLAVMRAGRSTPFATRMQTLLPAVERAFNLQQILQSSVGLRWSSIPPAQQQQLLAAFTNFTVATWVSNFDSYNGQTFQVLPQTRQIGNDQVVQTRIVKQGGDSTRLDYVMRQGSQGWQAVDILLDGSISRVAVQRSDFRSYVQGSDASPLIAMLRSKTADLSAGAKS